MLIRAGDSVTACETKFCYDCMIVSKKFFYYNAQSRECHTNFFSLSIIYQIDTTTINFTCSDHIKLLIMFIFPEKNERKKIV